MKRPLLVFGLMLAGPAAALGWLGWDGLSREDRLRRHEAAADAREAAERLVREEALSLQVIDRREQTRPYYHYQPRFMPEDVMTASGPALVESPLLKPADDPRIVTWFQVARTPLPGSRLRSSVEFFGRVEPAWQHAFQRAYWNWLLARLDEAPARAATLPGRAVAVPVQAVAANEEIGQLEEEVRVALQLGKNTLYLDNFTRRIAQQAAGAAEEKVSVKYTPFRYVWRRGGDRAAPPLLAWRLVWIPGAAARERRDAPVDRWLLQGYALDPSATLPATWRTVAPAVVARRGDVNAGPDGNALPADAWRAWLVSELDAEPAGEGPFFVPAGSPGAPGRVAAPASGGAAGFGDPDTRLSVVASPVASEMDAAFRTSLSRWFLVMGGLAGVVGVGFFVLWRSVRREVEAARRKEDFVAAVTHELKTPLTSIRMYAEMLREGWVPEGEASTEYADRIVTETRRLGSLVDQVLDLAAYERGVATFTPMTGDLGAAVRDATALVLPVAKEAGVPVAVEVEEGLPPVSFDPLLVRQTVVNLVDNAVKYSAKSATKDVRVLVRRDGATVALVVADKGVGIPASDRKRLFAPFQRGGREETRSARGVGLGLALVKRYADAHGASVSLESEEGVGTTVTVRYGVR